MEVEKILVKDKFSVLKFRVFFHFNGGLSESQDSKVEYHAVLFAGCLN